MQFVFTGEQAAPEFAQRHGNHGNRALGNYLVQAFLERLNFAVESDATLGKYSKNFAIIQGRANLVIGLVQYFWILCSTCDWDCLDRPALQ